MTKRSRKYLKKEKHTIDKKWAMQFARRLYAAQEADLFNKPSFAVMYPTEIQRH